MHTLSPMYMQSNEGVAHTCGQFLDGSARSLHTSLTDHVYEPMSAAIVAAAVQWSRGAVLASHDSAAQVGGEIVIWIPVTMLLCTINVSMNV